MNSSRKVGIRHRIKFSREGEARPTEVALRVSDEVFKTLKLKTEDDELDWVTGKYPHEFRKVEEGEDLGEVKGLNHRHIKWKKIKEDEDFSGRHASQLLIQTKLLRVTQVREGEGEKKAWRKIGVDEDVSNYVGDMTSIKTRKIKPGDDVSDHHASQIFEMQIGEPTHYASDIPIEYDGLKPGDQVVMTLGGSGDPLAYALSRRAEKLASPDGVTTGVYRVPPAVLKDYRDGQQEGSSKNTDHVLLVELFEQSPGSFYLTGSADRERIALAQLLRSRVFAQADRKAGVQRLESRLVGGIFMADDLFPEKSVADIIAAERTADTVIQALLADEDARTKELAKKVKDLRVFKKLFEPIKGVGPVLAASLMVAIGDPRRFMVKPDPEEYEKIRLERVKLYKSGCYEEDKEAAYEWLRESRERFISEGKYKAFTKAENFPSNLPYHLKLAAVAKYKAFAGKEKEAADLQKAAKLTKRLCKLQRNARNKSMAKICAFSGVHVMKGGKYADVPPEKQFPRRRSGQVCNWSPLARQALYLLADQFNRRPDSTWGKRFREEKRRLREEKHPEVIKVAGKQRYTNGHIHKMAIWKTLNKFVRWLYREWVKLEEEIAAGEIKSRVAV